MHSAGLIWNYKHDLFLNGMTQDPITNLLYQGQNFKIKEEVRRGFSISCKNCTKKEAIEAHVIDVWIMTVSVTRSLKRPFSKMEAENSNKLQLAKIKNVYQHQKEHQPLL